MEVGYSIHASKTEIGYIFIYVSLCLSENGADPLHFNSYMMHYDCGLWLRYITYMVHYNRGLWLR